MVNPQPPADEPPGMPGSGIGSGAPAPRRRRAVVALLLVAAAGLVILDLARGADTGRRPDGAAPAGTPTGAVPGAPSTSPPAEPGTPARPAPGGTGEPRDGSDPGRSPRPSPAAPDSSGAVNFPITGPGTWTYVAGPGPVHGRAGRLLRFRLAVERGANQDPDDFARRVDAVLADPRGWTAGGTHRFQRVSRNAAADFTILLATPGTSEAICATGGLRTEKFTNCRLPGRVVLNLARWWLAVPGYGAPLAEYQAYALNHELGHQLGHGHEACPGAGRPAPVMQQQTLGLRGCTANGWPYLGGRRYAGRPVP
ncbi:MAG TPA: DUF3152 domain-containing protein [Pilimelia sp.]|nr:DUF3152 domain-containing protein [Pilimelia sp.]